MPFSTTDDLHPNAAAMSSAIFRKMLLIGILGFAAIWTTDVLSGQISSFDAIAYPICLTAFALILLFSLITRINHQNLHLLSYLIVAGYLVSTSIWHHMAPNALFSNAAQWLGLNYVVAYLFLEVRKAAPATILVFIVTLSGHFFALIHYHNLQDTLGVVLNIAIAHLIYIFLLWTVIKLRVKTDLATQRVQILENIAYVDVLTRLLNRRGIEKVFNELKLDDPENKQHYALMILDIDYFKQFNDAHGHDFGDKVLSRIASKLSRTVHPNDVLSRWGGEEFLVLTVNRNHDQVMNLAEKLKSAVSQLVVDGVSDITISIGFALSHEADSKEAVFKLADHHLYRAKQAGRNAIRASHLP